MILSENVDIQISGKFSILFVVSEGLNKAGSEIFVLWNIVYNLHAPISVRLFLNFAFFISICFYFIILGYMCILKLKTFYLQTKQ